jgi:hypothetical protein
LCDDDLLCQVGEDGPGKLDWRPTPAGWRRADEVAEGIRGDGVFVAMSFAPDLKPVFDEAISPALEACGFSGPFRVDDDEHYRRSNEPGYTDKIDDRIIAGIRKARFVVVDVTHNRSAVYYEAGFAGGLGKPIIWCCREDRIGEDLCFDTRQIGHLPWREPADLRAALEARIRALGWALRG